MKKRLMISIVILWSLGSLTASAQTSPETVVANLYKAGKIKSVAEMSKTDLGKYFDDELSAAIWKAANGENGLDFDILYNAQDTEIKNFRIDDSEIQSPSLATVEVSFSNFGKKEEIQFLLASFGKKGWRIIEINYETGQLTKILSTE
jgi:hypothetical protein